MGIDKTRFNDSNIEIFLCGICHDIADDPVLINACEHCLCRACLAADIKQCPTCCAIFLEYHEIGQALKRIYTNMKLKCINVSCEAVLTVENYVEHELNCPERIYECPEYCGFKVQFFLQEHIQQHNCIAYLEEKVKWLTNKVAVVERLNGELQSENEQLKTNRDQHIFKRVRCSRLLKKTEQFYRCFTCQIRRMTAICTKCFEADYHVDHRYTLLESEDNNTYCDCGDIYMLVKGAPCYDHKF